MKLVKWHNPIFTFKIRLCFLRRAWLEKVWRLYRRQVSRLCSRWLLGGEASCKSAASSQNHFTLSKDVSPLAQSPETAVGVSTTAAATCEIQGKEVSCMVSGRTQVLVHCCTKGFSWFLISDGGFTSFLITAQLSKQVEREALSYRKTRDLLLVILEKMSTSLLCLWQMERDYSTVLISKGGHHWVPFQRTPQRQLIYLRNGGIWTWEGAIRSMQKW